MKKEYKRPNLKIVVIESSDILAGSPSPMMIDAHDEEVTPPAEPTQQYYGVQW